MVRHESGAHVLFGRIGPVTSSLVTDSPLQRVLLVLQFVYGWILVDAPADVSERTIWLLESGRLILSVASPDFAGYQAARDGLRICETLHLPARGRHLVRHATRGQPGRDD